VLFTRLERERERAVARGVLAGADEPPRHLPEELVAAGEDSEPHPVGGREPERARLTDDHVGADALAGSWSTDSETGSDPSVNSASASAARPPIVASRSSIQPRTVGFSAYTMTTSSPARSASASTSAFPSAIGYDSTVRSAPAQ